MGLLKPHTHTHLSRSLVLPRLTFLSVLIFLCWIIVFWPWTVSLVLDCYLPAFWPSCLPWYSALVSPLISLLPLPTIACTTVLTLIKAANGSQLRWLFITEDFARTRSSSSLQTLYWSLCPGQHAGRSSTTASTPHVSHRGVGNDFTSISAISIWVCSATAASGPSPSSTSSMPSHSMASPRLAYPEKFYGTPAKCKGFLLQCSLFVSQQPVLYPTEESRIAFLCSLLTGKALDWVTAVWNFNRPAFTSFESFFAALSSGFWSPWGRRWSRWTDPYIETREKYSSGVCSGFSHTGCTNWMAWWPFKAAFSQGTELGVTDWTRLSRRGKNFGSTNWSGHSHRQYDSL